MASVFPSIILVPAAAYDIMCKVKYVILSLLSYFTAGNSWFWKEFNSYNELITQFYFILLYYPPGSFVLSPLECTVLEKKAQRILSSSGLLSVLSTQLLLLVPLNFLRKKKFFLLPWSHIICTLQYVTVHV
jgi:hypothetical protein